MKRNSIGIAVVLFLLFVDLLIYKYQKANSPKGVIRCYPTGTTQTKKRTSDTIKYLQPLKNNYNEK